MAFPIRDFPDLLRLLEERPEWRAELRRLILTEELLAVPPQVRRLEEALAEHRRETDLRFRELAQRLDRLTARVDELTQRLDQLTARVDELTQRLNQLTARVDDLTQRLDRLTARVDDLARFTRRLAERVARLEGSDLERRYRERAPAYFGRLLARLRVLAPHELANLLEDAVEQGFLTDREAEQVLWTDLVARGRRRSDGAEAYLVAEVSLGIGTSDVRRARERADLLARLGLPALAVVAGQSISPRARSLALREGVWAVIDGRPLAPA